jgi:hypothetical protein
VQWDPERDMFLERQNHKAIQVGITGEIAKDYAKKWIVSIEDKTKMAREIRQHIWAGQHDEAKHLLPTESAHPVSDELAKVLGISIKGK